VLDESDPIEAPGKASQSKSTRKNQAWWPFSCPFLFCSIWLDLTYFDAPQSLEPRRALQRCLQVRASL
jgi:hypothetical protein